MDTQPSSITPKNKTIPVQVMLNYLVICLLMVCFSIVAVHAISAAIANWNGTFLVILAFLIAAESLASFRIIKNSNLLKSNPLISRISEWVVILIVVKIAMYLFSNPAQLLIDLRLWGHDFGSFFTKDGYFAVCFFLFFIWLLCLTFANYLDHLEEDKALLDMERQGDVRSTRPDARRGILALVFGMGLVMVFLTTLSNINLPIISLNSRWVSMDVILILLFFFLSLIILAQSQNSILRAHWYIERIPVDAEITPRWISFSILAGVFIVLISIILSLLLNSYSMGFFALIRTAFNFLVAVFSFLQVTILAPILGLVWLILRLLGQTGTPPPGPGVPLATPISPTPAPPNIAPSSLAELVQTILFWGIFLFVIIFAFRHYLGQRQELINGLRRFPLWSWIKIVIHWFSINIRLANRQISAFVDAGVARLQTFIRARPVQIDPLLTISSILPPRQRILLIYLSMVQWNNRNGFPRKGNQTPYEYARSFDLTIPESQRELEVITHAFIEARYTRHPLTQIQADLVQTALKSLQAILNQYLKQKSQTQEEL